MTVIGHIALIQRPKKQDIVLKVVKALKEKGHDVLALFAGECRDDAFLCELKETAAQEGLSENVLFLGRRNDIPDLLKVIDVLMIPSAFEGFPLAGLEAASAGVPVAACDVAGAKEFIDVSGGGMTFPEDDIAAAVTAVEYCIEHKQRLIENGKNFADSCALDYYKAHVSHAFAAI